MFLGMQDADSGPLEFDILIGGEVQLAMWRIESH